MSWASKVQHSRGKLVYLVRGKDQGRQAWYYILVEPTKLPQFKVKIDEGSLDLTDYGKILKSGWGMDPPERIKSEIQEGYG